MENKDVPGLSTENKIYIVIGYLAVMAYCVGMIWFSASAIVHACGPYKESSYPLHFAAIVFYALLILAGTVFTFFRLKKTSEIRKEDKLD